MNLSEFQIDLEKSINKVVKDIGMLIEERVIKGESEDYIRLKVSHLTIFIYEDGADFQGNKIDERYEAEGFSGELEELKKLFIKELRLFLLDKNKISKSILSSIKS